MVWCVVCVSSFSPPPLIFIGGSHPANEAKQPLVSNHETPHVTENRWGPWAATTSSGDLPGWPTVG